MGTPLDDICCVGTGRVCVRKDVAICCQHLPVLLRYQHRACQLAHCYVLKHVFQSQVSEKARAARFHTKIENQVNAGSQFPTLKQPVVWGLWVSWQWLWQQRRSLPNALRVPFVSTIASPYNLACILVLT